MNKNLIVLKATSITAWEYLVEKLKPDIGDTIEFIDISPKVLPDGDDKNLSVIYVDVEYERLQR